MDINGQGLNWDMAIDMLIELRDSKVIDYEYRAALDRVIAEVIHIPNKKIATLYVEIKSDMRGEEQ